MIGASAATVSAGCAAFVVSTFAEFAVSAFTGCAEGVAVLAVFSFAWDWLLSCLMVSCIKASFCCASSSMILSFWVSNFPASISSRCCLMYLSRILSPSVTPASTSSFFRAAWPTVISFASSKSRTVSFDSCSVGIFSSLLTAFPF